MRLFSGLSLSNHYPLMPARRRRPSSSCFWPLRRELLSRFGMLSWLVDLSGVLPYAWMVRRSWQALPISFNGPLETIQEILYFVSRAGYAGIDHSVSAAGSTASGFRIFRQAELLRQFGCGRHAGLAVAGLVVAVAHARAARGGVPGRCFPDASGAAVPFCCSSASTTTRFARTSVSRLSARPCDLRRSGWDFWDSRGRCSVTPGGLRRKATARNAPRAARAMRHCTTIRPGQQPCDHSELPQQLAAGKIIGKPDAVSQPRDTGDRWEIAATKYRILLNWSAADGPLETDRSNGLPPSAHHPRVGKHAEQSRARTAYRSG